MLINFIAITSKLLAAFGVLKIVAIFFSHNDLSQYYLFQNQIAVLQFIFSFGLINGFLNESVKKKNHDEFAFILKISIVLFLFISISSFAISGYKNNVIITSGFFIAIKSILYSILNGERKKIEYTYLVFLEMILLLLFIPFIYGNYGIYGVLFYQAVISFFISLVILYKYIIFERKFFVFEIDLNIGKDIIKNYLPYFKMALVSAFFVPSVYLVSRDVILSTYNDEFLSVSAIFASWRLSESLLIGVGSLCAILIIPDLSRKESVDNYLYKVIVTIIFIIALGYVLLNFFSDFFISTLLDEKYTKYKSIIFLLYITFSLRAISYILGVKLVFFKKTKSFIIIEISHATVFLCSVVFISYFKYEALYLSYAFLLQGLVCLILTFIAFYLSGKNEI